MQGLTDDARAARSAAAEARRQKLLARGQNRLASITIGNILDNAATGTTAAIPGTATTQHSKQQANQAGHSKVVKPTGRISSTPATAERALNWSRYGDAHPSASQASTKAKQGGLERPMRITKLQVLSIALETSQRLAILVATIGMLLVRPGGLQKKAINAKYIANARADMHMQLLRLLPGASEAAMSASSLLRALGTMANAVAVFLCAYALLIAIWDGEFQPWVESISSWGHQLMGCPHHALASKDL
ncbi:hypothetical protein WJX72_009519 [[Myrmecia] bisecta]|uniref:Uncharacterized protein n=1 Tax=[Myrmecia] bisecta TaxID=41462 RepID=A0AAW1R920_9CHLO